MSQITELARLDDAARAATPFLNAPDHAPDHAPDQASALSPQFLDLLSEQLGVIGELRRRRALWRVASRAA